MSYGSEWDGFLSWDYGNAATRDQFPTVPLSVDEQVLKAVFLPSGYNIDLPTITQPVQTIQAVLLPSGYSINLPTITQTTTATIICLPWSRTTTIPLPTITQPVQVIQCMRKESSTTIPLPRLIGPPLDLSDILHKAKRYRKRQLAQEEKIAAQILRERYAAEKKAQPKRKTIDQTINETLRAMMSVERAKEKGLSREEIKRRKLKVLLLMSLLD